MEEELPTIILYRNDEGLYNEIEKTKIFKDHELRDHTMNCKIIGGSHIKNFYGNSFVVYNFVLKET